MNLSNLKELVVDGIKLVELYINGVLAWKSGYKNWVKFSTESDGVTIYNGGLGYKNGYRVRSGGAEATANTATCCGFIPVLAGDIIGIGGVSLDIKTNENAINVYDSSYTNLGQITENYPVAGYGIFASGTLSNWNKGTYKDGCYYWTVPSGADIAYIRVTGCTGGNGAGMIVTVNEEIA